MITNAGTGGAALAGNWPMSLAAALPIGRVDEASRLRYASAEHHSATFVSEHCRRQAE
jgi:hypothetical protein